MIISKLPFKLALHSFRGSSKDSIFVIYFCFRINSTSLVCIKTSFTLNKITVKHILSSTRACVHTLHPLKFIGISSRSSLWRSNLFDVGL